MTWPRDHTPIATATFAHPVLACPSMRRKYTVVDSQRAVIEEATDVFDRLADAAAELSSRVPEHVDTGERKAGALDI